MDESIFNTETQEELQRLDEQSKQAGLHAIEKQRTAFFNRVLFLALIDFEYHVMYTLFRIVAGNDNPLWTPSVMGLSAMIVVAAVHICAVKSHHHPVVKFIDKMVSTTLPIYLLGIGLLLSVLLYKNGLSGILDADNVRLNFETMQMEGQSWVSWLMSIVISPAAALVFSTGLGVLAIISIFVAHHCFERAVTVSKHAKILAYTQAANQTDIAIYLSALKRFKHTLSDLQAQHLLTDEELKSVIHAEMSLKLQHANQQAVATLAEHT